MQRHRNNRPPMASINVVPYIDVMLVLLIIFMVTAPLLTEGVKVDLPQTGATTPSEPDTLPLIVTMKRDNQLFVNVHDTPEIPVTPAEMLTAIQKFRQEHPEVNIYVRADKDVSYGAVAVLLTDLKRANIEKVGLVTQHTVSENLAAP
jgi:biopolymer transport protein TolR